jgi:long-subunit fatty acid transport protein
MHITKFHLAIFLLLLIAPLILAQEQIPERLLLSTGQNVGSGARPLGLGGTFTGIADDYTSIWWNPAGLAQVKRIEVQGSLSRTGYGNKTNYYGGTNSGSTSSLRLNNAGVVFPVPVYQGALSFAFGYNQLVAFDRRTRITAPGTGTPGYSQWTQDAGNWNNFDELEDGRIGQWTFAGAMDVSQNLALGLGLDYLTGTDEYNFTGNYTANDLLHYREAPVTTDISGWGINGGALFRVGRYARIGVMIHSPVSMAFRDNWTTLDRTNNNENADAGYFDYRIMSPAVMRLGASFAPGRWLVGADLEYRDWTSMQFRSDTPYSGISRADANQQIKNTYRATTRLSLGGEYLFPAYGLRARAGYAFEPSPYQAAGSADNRNIFSVGMGLLVDRSVMFDLGVQFSSYKEQVTRGLTEDIKANNAVLTVSYRM